MFSPWVLLEDNFHCVPPNPKRVGNIVAVHGPLDVPNTYTPTGTQRTNFVLYAHIFGPYTRKS